MKVLRLKLVNFIGIMHGLGREEIEIDFSAGNHKIVMFRGGNGSGKSTIMGQLTPFKQSTDNRDQLILQGKDGRKEIDYEHNGHIYKITHLYPAKGSAQSFIQKDGKELNENGAVRAFEDIILKEFGITKDYFDIGKIGSNTRNFVDFSSADRKEYIGTFLDIEDYTEAYSIANGKLKDLKNTILRASGELKKFEDESIVKTKITQINEALKNLEIELEQLLVQKGKYDSELQKNQAELNKYNIYDLQKTKATCESNISKYMRILDESKELQAINNIKELEENLRAEITKLEADLRVLNAKRDEKRPLLIDYANRKISLETEIKSLDNEATIKSYESKIAELKSDLEKVNDDCSKNPLYVFTKEERLKHQSLESYLSKFKTFMKEIERNYTDLNKSSIDSVHANIEFFMKEDYKDNLERQNKQSRDAISGKRALLNEQEKERSTLSAHLSQLEILKKKPVECQIFGCPFIADALKWKNVDKDLATKDAEIKQSKEDISLMETKADNLSELSSLYSSFRLSYESVDPRNNPYYLKFVEPFGSLPNVLKMPVSDFQRDVSEFIDNAENAINGIDSQAALSSNISKFSEMLDNSKGNQTKNKERYTNELDDLLEKMSLVQDDINKLDKEINDSGEVLNTKKEQHDRYLRFITAKDNIDSEKAHLENVITDITAYNNLVNNRLLISASLSNTEKTISERQQIKVEKSKEYNTLNVALAQINSLNDKLRSLKDLYEPTKAVVSALDPKKGIPLIFMNLYLQETERITNELLDIAYNGEFKIKFEPGEKDFKIKVISHENEKDDISLASQGEVALTTISISLALIEQSIGAYNILCLDEIDGPLDDFNRSNFINILNSQIEKLGIEQVFVISHNNAFDTCALDMVLLSGNNIDTTNSGFMEDKTIVFDYTKN